MGVLINQMVGIISQCIHVSNHHNVHFKQLTISCQLYLNKAEFLKLNKELLFQVKTLYSSVIKPKAVFSVRNYFPEDCKFGPKQFLKIHLNECLNTIEIKLEKNEKLLRNKEKEAL